MTTVTIFANCQAGPMQALVNSYCENLTALNTPLVHQLSGDSKKVIFENIAKSNVIIHQPLGPSFGELASQALRERFPSKTFISFPSIFFGGFFPQLTYLRMPQGGTMKGPLSDYHDTRIIDSWLNGETETQCLDRITTTESSELVYYDVAMAESKKRDAEVNIPVMDIIEDEMQRVPPLFTFNHPTNRVLWRVLARIIQRLGHCAPDVLDRLPEREFLGNTRALIPDSIPASLGLTWRRSEYALWEDIQPMGRLIEEFYSVYNEHDNFADLCVHNADRFNLPVRIT